MYFHSKKRYFLELMGEFEPDIEVDEDKAGFKQDKTFDIGDLISQKERISYLDSCSRNVFHTS